MHHLHFNLSFKKNPYIIFTTIFLFFSLMEEKIELTSETETFSNKTIESLSFDLQEQTQNL